MSINPPISCVRCGNPVTGSDKPKDICSSCYWNNQTGCKPKWFYRRQDHQHSTTYQVPSKPKNDEEAQAQLKLLSEYFKEPVMPVSQYCKALETWAALAVKADIISEAMMMDVERGIKKSSLLNRLIYGGEKLRTKPCPIHKGEWSGLEVYDDNRCQHGCQLTGWLPEE